MRASVNASPGWGFTGFGRMAVAGEVSSMARIPTIKPRFSAQPMRLTAPMDEAGRSRYRDQNAPWRAWYKTSRWQRLRWQVLTEAMFTCAMCSRLEGQSRNLVADHIRPHRGSDALFWDRRNIQCLCKGCHDGAKQSMEKSGKLG